MLDLSSVVRRLSDKTLKMFGNNKPKYTKLEDEKKKSPKPDKKMSSGSLFTKVDDDKPYNGKFKKNCKFKII